VRGIQLLAVFALSPHYPGSCGPSFESNLLVLVNVSLGPRRSFRFRTA
jgi:hypothetical protein